MSKYDVSMCECKHVCVCGNVIQYVCGNVIQYVCVGAYESVCIRKCE